MSVILFWLFGILSIVASVVAVAARLPMYSIWAMLAVLFFNSLNLFVLSAYLLAAELLVITLGVFISVWFVLVNPRRTQLATPGRMRFNISKLIGFFIVIGLGIILFWSFSQSNGPDVDTFVSFRPQAEYGVWLFLVLLGTAGGTSYWVVVMRRREDKKNV